MQEELSHLDTLKLFRQLYQNTKKGDELWQPVLVMTTNEQSVAACLLSHRNPVTLKCCPGYKRIAKTTHMSIASVARCLKRLEEIEAIYRHKVYCENELKRTQYFFWFELEDIKRLYDDENSMVCRDPIEGLEEFFEADEKKIPF